MVLENFIATLQTMGSLLWSLIDSLLTIGTYIVVGFVVFAIFTVFKKK